MVVNLSSHHTQIGTTALDLPVARPGLARAVRASPTSSAAPHYDWGQFNYLELDPYREPAHVFAVTFAATGAVPAAGRLTAPSSRPHRTHERGLAPHR